MHIAKEKRSAAINMLRKLRLTGWLAEVGDGAGVVMLLE